MSAIIKQCACGAKYDLARWNDLPDARVYKVDPDDPQTEVHEQRRCPCGSHIVVPIVNGQPHAVDRAGNLVGTRAGVVFVAGLLLIGCGGPPFVAADRAAIVTVDAGATDSGVDQDAPDAGRDDDGGGSPTADGGSEAEGSTELGPDGDAADGGQADAPDPLMTACETYYRAYATTCTCRPTPDASGQPCSQQWDDAGGLDCTRNDLDVCQPACGWDGGPRDYGQYCACVFACLGACAPTNGLYFACAVASCDWATCP